MKPLKKIIVPVLVLLILCAVFPAVSADPTGENSVADINPVTGTSISNSSLLQLPPVFVPLARYPSEFRPSSGHSMAQWVFEMYVDKEESRPILMFYGELPSAPISHISSGIFGLEELRRQYGGIIIMGGTSKSILESDIRSYELWYGQSGSEQYPVLPAVEYQRILNKWALQTTPADPNNLKYEFDEAVPEGGRKAISLFVRYAETNQILWEYDPMTGKYMRGQNSDLNPKTIAADVDSATADHIGVENLIILFAHHTYVPGFETQPGVFTVELNYVDSNPALILRDGRLYNAVWTTKSEQFEQESSRMRPIRFMDETGKSFSLKPGRTWVHIVMTGNPYYEVEEELGSDITAGTGFWKMPYISFKPGSQEEVEGEVEELKGLEYRLNPAE